MKDHSSGQKQINESKKVRSFSSPSEKACNLLPSPPLSLSQDGQQKVDSQLEASQSTASAEIWALKAVFCRLALRSNYRTKSMY